MSIFKSKEHLLRLAEWEACKTVPGQFLVVIISKDGKSKFAAVLNTLPSEETVGQDGIEIPFHPNKQMLDVTLVQLKTAVEHLRQEGATKTERYLFLGSVSNLRERAKNQHNLPTFGQGSFRMNHVMPKLQGEYEIIEITRFRSIGDRISPGVGTAIFFAENFTKAFPDWKIEPYVQPIQK